MERVTKTTRTPPNVPAGHPQQPLPPTLSQRGAEATRGRLPRNARGLCYLRTTARRIRPEDIMTQAARPGRAIVLLSVAGLGGLCASSIAPASGGSGIASHGPGGGANDAVRRQDTWSQERALHSSRGSRRRPRPTPVQQDDAQQQRAEESEQRPGGGLDRKGMFNSFSLGEHEPSSYYDAISPPGGGLQQQQQQQQQDEDAFTGAAAAGYDPTCDYNDEGSGSREFFNDESSGSRELFFNDYSEEPLQEEQQQQQQQAPYSGSIATAAAAGGRASHYYPGRGRNAAENLAAQQFQGYGGGRSSSSPSYRHEPFFFNGENPYSSGSSSSSRGNGKRRRRARGGGVMAASAFPAISPALAATAAAAAAAAAALVKIAGAAALALSVLAPLAAALSSHWAYFVAGGICAAISHTAAVPLDVIKTRIQCAPPGVEYRGTWDALVRIIRSEGARVLFCGAGATLVGYALQGSLKFGFFEFLKPVFSGLFARGSRGAAAAVGAVTAPPVLGTLIAASVTAEIVGSSALTPLEAARIRMVADADYAPGLRSGIARMVSEEGVAALTRGLPAVLAKQIPYTVTKLVTFDYLVRKVASLVSRNGSGGTGVGGTVACAVIAGVLSSLASQPGDSLLSALNSEGRNAGVEGGGVNMVAGFDEMMSDVTSEDGSGSMSDSGSSGSGSEEQQSGGGEYYQYSPDASVSFGGSDAPAGQLQQQQQQQQPQVEPVIRAMARIAREAGFSGLFRGTGARMMHVTSIVTLQLLIYQSIKTMVGIAS